MAIRIRPRLAASIATGIVVFAGSLAAMRADGSYRPVFGSCAASTDLVVVGNEDTSVNHQRQQLIDQWNANAAREHHPRARLVQVSETADLLHSQLMAAEQSGSCGYDVLMLDVVWTAEFARDGLIRPIPSGDIDDQEGFIPTALRTGQWNGRQYAIPYSTNVGLLYYKKDAVPPRTWADLVSRGYAGQFADYEGLTVNALEAIWNDGGPDVLTGTSARLTPQTVKTKVLPALGALAAAMRKGNPQDNPLRASRSFDELDSQNAFADGQQLLRDWPDAYGALAADPRQWSDGDLAFGVKPLPGGHGALGGDDLAVATASRHREKQALDLIARRAPPEAGAVRRRGQRRPGWPRHASVLPRLTSGPLPERGRRHIHRVLN